MIENQHSIKYWAQLSMNCYNFFWRSSLRTCVSTKSFIKLSSRPRTVAYNKKILLVKYIYKKQLIKNMDVIKKNLTIRFTCETNIMEPQACVVMESLNMLVQVLQIGQWSSGEMHGHHVLNVLCPYSLWDVQQSKILPNCHVIPTWKLFFFCIFFYFVLRLVQKITQSIWYKLIIC
jgi:hypothetical protein